MKVVVVHFVDTNIHSGWRAVAHARRVAKKDDLMVQAVGFCEDPDKFADRIVLHSLVSDAERHASDMVVIPREAVKKVEVLGWAE